MAKHGADINSNDDYFNGIARFLAASADYHEEDARLQGLRLWELMTQKLAIKHRLYGTKINDPEQETRRRASAYRKAAGG